MLLFSQHGGAGGRMTRSLPTGCHPNQSRRSPSTPSNWLTFFFTFVSQDFKNGMIRDSAADGGLRSNDAVPAGRYDKCIRIWSGQSWILSPSRSRRLRVVCWPRRARYPHQILFDDDTEAARFASVAGWANNDVAAARRSKMNLLNKKRRA